MVVNHAHDVREIRHANPYLTLAQIGAFVGIGRERVRQILKEAGLPTSALIQPPEGGYRKVDITVLLCAGCHKQFIRPTRDVLRAARTPRYRGIYVACSRKCTGAAAHQYYSPRKTA